MHLQHLGGLFVNAYEQRWKLSVSCLPSHKKHPLQASSLHGLSALSHELGHASGVVSATAYNVTVNAGSMPLAQFIQNTGYSAHATQL